MIQSRVEEYFHVHAELPTDIASLYPGVTIPEAPPTRPAYSYTVNDAAHYTLCATFSAQAPQSTYAKPLAAPNGLENYTWDYTKGEHCFFRTVLTTPVKTAH